MSTEFDRSKLFRASTLVALATVLNGIVSFGNQAVLAKIFGSGSSMEAYLVGNSLPLLASGLLGALISYSIVPVLLHAGTEDGERDSLEARLFWLIAAAVTVIALACATTSFLTVPLLAPKLSVEAKSTAIHVASISWIGFILTTLTTYNAAAWNAKANFVRPALAAMTPLLGALCLSLTLGRQIGALAPAFGTAIGASVGFLWLAPGANYRIGTSSTAKQLAIGAIQRTPLILASMAVFTIYGSVDSYFATRIGESTLSYLGYSQRLLIGLGALVTAGPFTVVLPLLSKLHADGEADEFRRVVGLVVRTVAGLSAGLASVVGVLRYPVIHVLLQRGKFTALDTDAMAGVFGIMLLGMVPMLATSIMFRALYAKRDLASAAIIGLSGAVGYIVLSAIFSSYLGLLGFGVAYTANWIILFIASLSSIWRGKLGRTLLRVIPSFAKEVVPAAILGSGVALGTQLAVSKVIHDGFLQAFVVSGFGFVFGVGTFVTVSAALAPKGSIAGIVNRFRGKLGRSGG